MAGRTVTWLLVILVVTLFGMNGFLLLQLANNDGPKSSPNINNQLQVLAADRFGSDDGKFDIRIAHLFLLHVSILLLCSISIQRYNLVHIIFNI